MNEAVSQQPVCSIIKSLNSFGQENIDIEQQGPEGMSQVHMRGGGEEGDVCCGICAGLCCFECCECCC
ncbi:hypothetical protein N7509_002879 [Penicillium cosmopolitanum]|uniref:Cysteine-rich transmembrane CYSTM domain-containing protein n=1 Tax=Penicillium cosmopolitanum TaxID=1131564 RepID=A0A9W9W9M1_9EURO|nr:uncharacterized protein N7509_002879 [Penicillium cosmopolitanum]KAJ5408996.1 hypothetical protein N7509_002879 [Penicillium cosmopolitanum]